jgi:hypothetical protein
VKALATKPFVATAIAATLALAVSFSAAGQSASDKAAAIPAIKMENVPLANAIRILARQARLNFSLDPKLARPQIGPDRAQEKLVTVRLENMSASRALVQLLDEQGLHMVKSEITSVARITFRNQTLNPVDKAWVTDGENAVIPLIQMIGAPLAVAITDLAKQGKLNVEVDASLSQPSFVPGKPFTRPPTVEFRWEILTARQAIGALCENYGCIMFKDYATGTLRISMKVAEDGNSSVSAKEK